MPGTGHAHPASHDLQSVDAREPGSKLYVPAAHGVGDVEASGQ